jgi:hypothetical protein
MVPQRQSFADDSRAITGISIQFSKTCGVY